MTARVIVSSIQGNVIDMQGGMCLEGLARAKTEDGKRKPTGRRAGTHTEADAAGGAAHPNRLPRVAQRAHQLGDGLAVQLVLALPVLQPQRSTAFG